MLLIYTTMATNNTKKNDKKYTCILCDFMTSKKTDYSRHLETIKHKNNQLATNSNKIATNYTEKTTKCEICNKIYNDRTGLWRHKKKCKIQNISNESDDKNEMSDKELIISLIKETNDYKNIIMKFIEVGNNNTNSNNNTNISNINSNNKSFNLNLFLNETCKNAMNITDFINSIQLNLSDLEKVGELGYVEGISKIIIDNLKLLDVTERPFHCSDLKREVMYVKDKDKWEKDNEQNTKIKKVISCVTNKNISLIPKWKKENPDCTNINSNKSTKINKMIMEVMETDKSKDEKIIKNIAKEITINKF